MWLAVTAAVVAVWVLMVLVTVRWWWWGVDTVCANAVVWRVLTPVALVVTARVWQCYGRDGWTGGAGAVVGLTGGVECYSIGAHVVSVVTTPVSYV